MDTDTPNPAPRSKLADDTPVRKSRGLKIALIILLVLVVLFVCTIVFLPYFLPIGTIRSIAKTQARELAGMDVDFKDLRFGWNGDVVLDGVTVAPIGPDGVPGETLLAVNTVRTNVALTPLLSGKAVVNSVDVDGFTLTLVRQPDGSLNLPNLDHAAGNAATETAAGNGSPAPVTPVPSAAPATPVAPAASAASGGAGGSLPPVELRSATLRNGVIAFSDPGQDLHLDLGVDQVKITGKTLDDPFLFSGRVLPHRDNPQLGDVTFSGHAAILRGGQFNPDGEISLEAAVNTLSLAELAEKLHLDDLLASAHLNGALKAAYADRKGGLNLADMRLSDAVVAMGDGATLALPDSTFALDAVFDPASDNVRVGNASVRNDILDLRAQGGVGGVLEPPAGGLPSADFEFTGSANFSNAARYASTRLPGLEALPEIAGEGDFSGRLNLPEARDGAPPAPTLALDFSSGSIEARDPSTGVSAGTALKGVGLRAAAALSGEMAVTSRLDLASVPVHVLVPQFGDEPLAALVTGGLAFDHSPEKTTAELRVTDASAQLPATPYSTAASLANASLHLTADLANDVVSINGADATINDAIRGGVAAGEVSGVLAGKPHGTVDLQLSALLEHLKALAAPIYPADILPTLTGSLRASTRVKFENNAVEALVRSEVDNTQALVNLEAQGIAAQVATPKTTLALMASASLDNPSRVTIHSLEAAGGQTSLRVRDADGAQFAGQTGNSLVKAAAVIDADAMLGELSAFSADLGGLNLSLVEDGRSAATLTTGLVKVVAAAPDRKATFPLSGNGDFALPALDLGVDDLVFAHAAGGGQPARLGGVRARLAADGFIGSGKRQLINIRTASLAATPVAVNSRAQIDLDTGAFLAEYAARVAPAGLSTLLAFAGLPPSLLTDAAATGTVEFDDNRLIAKGSAQGQLQISQGRNAPFEMAHDLTAAWDAAEQSLSLAIRRLDGGIKTSSGEAVASMAAQPSQLLLSRAGSRGLLDIRFNGAAGPTHAVLLGLAGVLPQLDSLADTLAGMRAEGVYSAWVQVKEKDPVTLSVNVGGTWKGAALTLGDVPFLAEAGELAAALEGDFAYQQNTVDISRLLLRSESAQMQGEGAARIVYTADANQMPVNLARVETDMKFVMADLARAARVFPGVIPASMNLTGRVDGAFRAGGDADNVQIHQGEMRFQNFRAVPASDLEVTIPSGAATFGATLAFRLAGTATGSPYDIFRMVDIMDGKANLTGAMVRGKQVSDMSTSFRLENGVLSFNNARLAIGGGAGGSVLADGGVDFNGAEPAVTTRLAMRNIPLAEFNSELENYLTFDQGVLHLPAQEGQAADVAFVGLSEDDILRTLRLGNFSFATGPIKLHTGPLLNQELDKARGLMRQQVDSQSKSREITLKSIDGTAQAGGTGVITIPESAPINVLGDNTGDFRFFGEVRADHTLTLRVMVAGGLDRLIGFTLPNLIPSLRQNPEESNRFMAKMNDNAAKGHYGLTISGSLSAPDISGISELAVRFLTDMATALPGQLIGGVLDLGKDAPKALMNLGEGVVGGILNPGETLKNAPENIIRTPENVVKGLGQMFGITRGGKTDGKSEGGGQ